MKYYLYTYVYSDISIYNGIGKSITEKFLEPIIYINYGHK